jgi:hypothetical protein
MTADDDLDATWRSGRGGPSHYDADRGIRTGHRETLTPIQFDTQLVTLANRGLSQRQIAKALGITHQGVSKALKRIRAGGFGKARDARH